MIVALFDLDGTLYTGHILKGISAYHREHRTKLFYLYSFLITHMAIWPICRLGLVSELGLREMWLRDMAWTVRGWTPQEANEAFEWIAREYVQPLVRPEIIARLRDHRSSGHRTVLVSGTFSPLLAAISRQLGIDDAVGTPLVVRKGRYVGACELPLCQGMGKWLRVQECFRGDSVDWAGSYAYADSHVDIPLLDKVGHPVAVTPDPQLTAYAQERGWEIIEDVLPDAGWT